MPAPAGRSAGVTVWLLAAARMSPGSDVGLLTAVPSGREVHLAEADGRPAEVDAAPCSSMPERAQLVGGGLQDDGLDEDLPAAHVEIADHAAQRLPVRGRGAHDERVGGGVGRDAHGSLERDGRAGPGADRLRLRRRCGRRRRLAHPAVVADGRLAASSRMLLRMIELPRSFAGGGGGGGRPSSWESTRTRLSACA